MVFKGKKMETTAGRTHYPIEGKQKTLKHFVCRVTTPNDPFGPHKHDGEEFWYIVEGRGTVSIDGEATEVEAGDLVVLLPWTNHGLTSETMVRWLCLG